METWKEIKNYEGLYEITCNGVIKSLPKKLPNGGFRKEKLIKLILDKNGYYRVRLWKNGKVKWFSVHRLVAETFLPNPNNLPCVNHKDENKLNNHVSNLEWCTYEYNNNYGTKKERCSQNQKYRVHIRPVLQFDLDGNFIREWKSIIEAEEFVAGKRTGLICKAANPNNNRLKTYKGYLWRYK